MEKLKNYLLVIKKADDFQKNIGIYIPEEMFLKFLSLYRETLKTKNPTKLNSWMENFKKWKILKEDPTLETNLAIQKQYTKLYDALLCLNSPAIV